MLLKQSLCHSFSRGLFLLLQDRIFEGKFVSFCLLSRDRHTKYSNGVLFQKCHTLFLSFVSSALVQKWPGILKRTNAIIIATAEQKQEEYKWRHTEGEQVILVRLRIALPSQCSVCNRECLNWASVQKRGREQKNHRNNL